MKSASSINASKSPNNKTIFPVSLLTVALFLTATVFIWFIAHIHNSHDAETLPVVSIAVIFALAVASFLAAIRRLSKARSILLHNTTEREWAKKTLQESEARYRMLFDSNPNPILVYDLETLRILAVNDEAILLYGYSREEFLALTIKDIRSAENIPFLLDQVAIAAATKEKLLHYSQHQKKDGAIIEVEIAAHHVALDGKTVRLALITDVTERKRAEEKLRESEFKLRTLIESTSEGIVQVDNDEKIEFVNDSFCEMSGYSREELLGKITLDILFDEEGSKLVSEANCERREGISSRYEAYLKTKSGEKLYVIICGAPIMDVNGSLAGTMAVFTNITTRKRAETALRESEYKLRILIESMNEGLLRVDESDSIQFVNQYFCEMLGYSQDELIGRNWSELMLDDEGRELIRKVNQRRREGVSDKYELRLHRKTGETIWALVSGAPLFGEDERVAGSFGIFTDITERKRAEEQLLHDAFHDSLTGLANRALFMDHLRMTIERCKSRRSNPYAVLFLDFDRFKMINDSLGHAEGDKLLEKIARRLESSTRTGDLLARLGGDEFVILLSEMLEASDAVYVAERILENLKKPFNLSGNEIFVSASIGIALSAAGHGKAEDMLRDADIAMYRAKAKGKARYQIFDRAMHKHASRQLSLETEMRQALERGEFFINYQPILQLQNESLIGFEALIRWKHPTRGLIPPAEFIPAAEENNLILPLGRWILQESCRQLREWQQAYPHASNLSVSVNLSSKQFSQFNLTEQVTDVLAATTFDPKCLKLEITESQVMENSKQATLTMKRLRALGVELSLDDFGTGYSSLSYLHRLPINHLKIDRSFITRMSKSEENREIVSTIIKLAQNLKMKVVAEGIETGEQLERLKQLNCEFGQGYFFSKPLIAADAAEFIENHSPDFSLPAGFEPKNLRLIG